MARSTGKTKTVASSGGKRVGASRKMPRIARIAQRLGRMIPDEEVRQVPSDLSSQIDHYVYGMPNSEAGLCRHALLARCFSARRCMGRCAHGDHTRRLACRLVREILNDPEIEVVSQSHESFLAGLALYERRPDKHYSLADCISMNVMRKNEF
jgi:hypothetical protein